VSIDEQKPTSWPNRGFCRRSPFWKPRERHASAVGSNAFGVNRTPDGAVYPIPSEAESRMAYDEITKAADAHRRDGGQVVVVQGLGFEPQVSLDEGCGSPLSGTPRDRRSP
jgi:hypothetical protein